MAYEADIVVVGAGIAGGSLATVLARQGLTVLLLEKSQLHRDMVRGEFLAPWGVQEATQLGVLDVLMDAGAQYVTKSVPYGEGIDPVAARARIMSLANLVEGVPGGMTFGHPQMCQALDDAAVAAGATILRGVSGLEVQAGSPPKLAFTHDGQRHELSPRLIVGADGRGSSVARQAGLKAEADPDHHFLVGMLVESSDVWPDDEYTIATEGDVIYYVMPRTGGQTRLYLGYGVDQPARFSGPDRERKFLEAFRLSSLPQRDMYADARPLGPCHGYPNADHWIDTPLAPGIVLIGDAAGHNDPTIGQGLAIAFRDARLVSEVLLGGKRWGGEDFAAYSDERRERLRRLRFTARHFSIWRAEFGAEAHARRQRAFARLAADPRLFAVVLPLLTGPYGAPAQMFEPGAWDRLLN